MKQKLKIYDEEKEILYKYIPKEDLQRFFDVSIFGDLWDDFLDIIDDKVLELMDDDYELTPAARELERLRDTLFYRNTED